jgi:SNF2 family DNA or RNA helicase
MPTTHSYQINTLPNYDKLRPYQVEDINKLLQYDSSACFNEQRTGKTPIAIMVMEVRQPDRTLIVCPASMLYPWRDSYKFWTGKDAAVCVGTPLQRMRIVENWEHGPLIISYGCLKETIRTGGMLDDIIKKKPTACIADEAHHFKCHTTATAKAMYKLIKVCKYRLALTGTPATNKPSDIYGILHWLYPDTFKSYWKFIYDNFQTYKRYTGFNQSHTEIGDWLPTRQAIMSAYLNKFTTQRKRADVMPWLPPKDYTKVRLPATSLQNKYLRELDEYFETEHVVAQAVLDRMMRERQICVAPKILDLKGSSPKMNWIVDFLKDYPEKKVLIFSKFKKGIALLHQMLCDTKFIGNIITGETNPKMRSNIVNAFQQNEYQYLILQIDACKEGLTLDNADVEIFLDVYPPAADIQQAEDRFVATTQDKKDKPHQVTQLILEDTYDEECYNLVERRADSIECINSYIKYINSRR